MCECMRMCVREERENEKEGMKEGRLRKRERESKRECKMQSNVMEPTDNSEIIGTEPDAIEIRISKPRFPLLAAATEKDRSDLKTNRLR